MSLKNAAMAEQEKPEVNLPADWNPDHFPTSARKVFIGWGVLIAGVIILCSAVYFSSEHPADPVATQKKSTANTRLTEMNQAFDEDAEE